MKNGKSPITRSENMSRVKGKNTGPEIYLRKLLWNNGIRYRINYKDLPGKPDIYISKYKAVIFVNGCFWHMHENCKLSTIPKTNYDFWQTKLTGNVERDKLNYEKLKQQGFSVIIIWGCEIKKMMKDKETETRYITQILNRLHSAKKHKE